MRVLIVTNTYPPGDISGVGTLALELARRLDAAGHPVRVLTRRATPDDPWAVTIGGPKLHFPARAALAYLRLARGAGGKRDRGGEEGDLRGFDLVHLHESDGVLVALAARLGRLAGRRGPRLLATLQVSYVEERRAVREVRARPGGEPVSRPTPDERVFARLRAPLLAFLGRLTVRLADRVVAPSRATAAELARDYGAREVAVIPNGVEPTGGEDRGVSAGESVGGGGGRGREEPGETGAPAGSHRSGTGAGTGTGGGAPGIGIDATAAATGDAGATASGVGSGPRVLYAGRLRTRKAVAVLVEAMALLCERFPGATLRLVGDGPQRPALEAQIERLGLGGAVELTGAVPRSAMPAFYDAADIFCLPSLYEGLPLAILEAMAAGLPVVATAVSGNPEAVADGETGLLVPPEDAPTLAEALATLAADPARAREMGAAGRRRIERELSIEAAARAYLDLWEGGS